MGALKCAVFLVIGALSTACVTARVFPSSINTYPPVPTERVLVFFDDADITVPYEVLGEILLEGSSGVGQGQAALVKKGQQEAGKMGANAILVLVAEDASATSRVMAALFWTNDNNRRVRALRLTPE
jgi:hypothetical protein